MVRFSDFLKRKEKAPEEAAKPAKEAEKKPAEAPPEAKVVKPAEPARKELTVSRKLYDEAVVLLKGIVDKLDTDKPVEVGTIAGTVVSLVNQLILDDRELLEISATSREEVYLYEHLVNVCILCIEVGLALEYNKSKLNELGICAFLYDIGMVRVLKMVQKRGPLTEKEYAEVKKHTAYSKEMLAKIDGLYRVALLTCEQHHERMDGSGYPNGLKAAQIHEYAKIISLVDTYEAMTHRRTHRNRTLHHEAIKSIMEKGEKLFDASIVKALVKRLGLYPIGSWVELNTNEVGKVVSINVDYPLRPKVELFFGPHKEKLEKPKSLDLVSRHSLYIKNPIDESEFGV